MRARPRNKAQIAAEAWRLLFDFVILTGPQRSRVLGRLGLTPNDARALGTLEAREGRTMRSLAEAWSCDASNVTWMVDRLEKKGLAQRLSRPGDRRVKLVALTPAGVTAKAALQAGIYDPPPELRALPRRALEALLEAAAHLPGRSGGSGERSE
jgi:DNA-binding MarR family transcriptional regulator